MSDNKGKFSKDNQPMNNEESKMKKVVSNAINNSMKVLTSPRPSNKHLKPEIVEYIGEAILKERPNGKSWVKTFIDDTLKIALKDFKSPQAQRFLNILFRDDLLDELENLYNNKTADDKDYALYKVRQTLYDKQQEVYDNSTDNRILIINSRRSGKTELLGRLIVKELLSDEDAHVVYINRNSSAAKRQIRKPLETALSATTNISIVKGSIDAQEIYFNNGSQLLIIGNNNAADIDKLRGERISLCLMDECGHQRNTKHLIREVIGPALIDYGEKSKLVLVGTPPRIPHTYIEECYNNDFWKKYHWTFMDNPFIPNKENVIKEACEENGVEENSAFIQREYYGRMDAYDDDARVIKKYSIVDDKQIRNTANVWDYCWIGVDWGYEDLGAIITVIANKISKRAFVVNSWSKAKTGVDEKAKEIQRQIEWVKDNFNLAREPWVICDTNNKEAASDLVNVYHIKNVFTAYKYDRDNALDSLSDMLASNKITFLDGKTAPLIEDCDSTLWTRDEETDKILHTIDDDVWHPNSLMALLYVSRQFSYDVLGWIDRSKEVRRMLKDSIEEYAARKAYIDEEMK